MLLTDARNKEITDRLRSVASWNGFARQILAEFDRGGLINANQMAAAERMMNNLDAKPKAVTANVDLSRIREMFEVAVSNGHQKPVYRAEGLKISLAPATGRNAGALYVVMIDDDAYQGKVEGVTFKAVREAAASTVDALHRIAANPMDAAVRYGQKTGKCSCCGRKLTNKVSIELGIGPICAETWGL
jgi:hypothetical protein